VGWLDATGVRINWPGFAQSVRGQHQVKWSAVARPLRGRSPSSSTSGRTEGRGDWFSRPAGGRGDLLGPRLADIWHHLRRVSKTPGNRL